MTTVNRKFIIGVDRARMKLFDTRATGTKLNTTRTGEICRTDLERRKESPEEKYKKFQTSSIEYFCKD